MSEILKKIYGEKTIKRVSPEFIKNRYKNYKIYVKSFILYKCSGNDDFLKKNFIFHRIFLTN